MSQVVELFALCGDRMDIYSGEDAINLPVLAMGGAGFISVTSNVAPGLAAELANRFFAGNVAGAAALQCRLTPLNKAMFCEVNPIPVKAAVSAMGFGQEHLRLPLTPMEPEHRQTMLEEMRKLGILV